MSAQSLSIERIQDYGRKRRTRTAPQAPRASVLPLHHVLYTISIRFLNRSNRLLALSLPYP